MNERYELQARIAEGGRGTIFKAWDKQLGREVAVKRLRPDASAAASAWDELLREARLQSSLKHPNIAAVYDSGADEQGAFLVMELLLGETLEEAVSRAPLTTGDFDALVRQALSGMSAAHEAGLVHLDLKSGNLLLSPRDGGGFQVKVLDFGLARAVTQDQRTEAGVPGSVFFMAPEQFERGAVDARADVYALGCVFYHALTQRHPFEGELAPQVIVAHLHHRRQPLAALRPDLPAPLTAWVERLMSRQPADRPVSATEALQSYPGVV